MNTDVYVSITPMAEPAAGYTAELERLGDEIAVLSAHLDAATAHLLELIREFDARAGWNTGFRSCAEWLSWRVGLDPGAARVSRRRRYGRDPGTARSGGGRRADPGADRGPRSAVSQSARPKRSRGNVWRRRVDGASHDAAAAGGRAGPRRRDRAPPRNRSRRSRRALPGRGARRRAGAGGRGGARSVGPRRRRARLRRNVAASGVRCEPGDDATRSGWPHPRSRCPDAHHSAGAAARAAPSRSRMPLPGLWATVRPGSSHPPLGSRRPDDSVEPRPALSASSSRRPRGGLPGRATARRRAEIPSPRRPASARKPTSACGPQQSRRDATRAARRVRAEHPRANGDAGLAWRAARRWVGDRRLAPVGGYSTRP